MGLPTLPTVDVPEVLAGQIISTAEEKSANLGRDLWTAPLNVPLALVDSTVSSLANITDAVGITDFNLSDGIMPSGWDTYQRNRGAWTATADVIGMFAVAGAASKAIRAGGAVGGLAKKAGLSDRAIAAMVSHRGQIAAIENEFGAVTAATSNTLASSGLQAAGVTDVAVPWASLSGAVRTADEVQAMALRLRTSASIKEAVASEIAVATLFNDSEFLFPADMSLGGYIMTAGMVGGLFATVDRAVGAAGFRRSLAQAAKTSKTVAAVRGSEITYDQASLVSGDRWTTLAASANEYTRADELLRQASAGVLEDATAASVTAAAQRIRQAAGNDATLVTRQLFGDANLPGVSQVAKGTQEQEARAIAWSRADQKNSIGLQGFEDAAVISRQEVAYDKAYLDLEKAMTADDAVAIDAARARVRQLDGFDAGVIEVDGATNLRTTRQTPWQETAPAGKKALRRAPKTESYTLQDRNAPKLSLTKNGQIVRAKGKVQLFGNDLAGATFPEITSMYKAVGLGAADTTDRGFAAAFGANFEGAVESLPYPVLDAIQQGMLGVGATPAAVRLAGSVQSGAVAREALFQKFAAFAHAQEAGLENAFDLSKRLNMRMHTEVGQDSILFTVLEEIRASGATDLRGYFGDNSFTEIVDALAGLAAGAQGADAVGIAKKQLASMITDAGQLAAHEQGAPVGFVRKVLDGASDTDANLAKVAETARQMRMYELATTENSLLAAVRDTMAEMPKVVDGLSDVGAITRDGLIESRGLGASAARQVTQTTNRFREIPAIQFANTFHAVVKRRLEKIMTAALQPVADAHNAVLKAKRYDLLAQHSDYSQAFRIGAELQDPLLVGGRNALAKDSPRVVAMVRRVFGKTVDELAGEGDLYLFDKAAALRGEYVPLELTDEGAAFTNGFIAASYAQLENHNQIARVLRRSEVNRVNGHVPVANFRNLELRYLADESGRVVGHVQAKTAHVADKLQADAMRAGQGRGENLIPASEAQIKGWVETADQGRFAQLVDFGDPLMQRGMTKGKDLDVTRDVSGDLGVAQLLALRESYDQLGKDATYAAFESVILKNKNLMQAGNASSIGNRQGVRGIGKGRAFFNANEEWQNVLMGNSTRPEGSVAQQYEDTTSAWLDDVIDAATQKLFPTDGSGPANALRRARNGRRQQAAIDKIVSDYDPMGAAVEAIARTKTLSQPDTRALARTLQQANQVTGEVFLKFMNIAHPILNGLSLLVTTPSVAQQVTRRASETVQQWERRVGHMSEFMDGESVATVSPTKLMANGMQFFHSDAGKQVLAEAQGHGMITSNMLEELNQAIFTVPTRAGEVAGSIRRYADLINGPVNAAMRAAGKNPSADTLSERSETYVRGLLHTMGYHFIDKTGQKGLTNLEKHSFGEWFANQNIADYAPNIRGQAFRGVAGIPLGLFQSFGINFLQRNFRYLENTDTRALAVQAATQTAVFGAEGLPGWPLVNEYFMAAHDKGGPADSSFTDRIYGAYGKQVGDVLMTGTISNLPRLFGAGDGMNFYTSGDTNPRIAGFKPPALSLATQTIQMVADGTKAAIEDMRRVGGGGQFDSNRVAEVVASYMPNRGVRSMLELGLGYATDRAGNLVQEDTRSGISLLSRLLGTRTVDEGRQRNALWQNSVDLQHRNSRLSQVGRAFTAAIRAQSRAAGVPAGEFSVPQEMLDQYLARWVAAGGRRDTARTAFNRMIAKAGTTSAQAQMNRFVGKDGVLKGGDVYQFGVERLLQYGYNGE